MAYGGARGGRQGGGYQPGSTAARAYEQLLPPLSDDDEQAAMDAAMAGEDEEDPDPWADLLTELQAEAQNSLGLDGDQIATDQVRAFERYIGKDYGDEVKGQSRVHTREVFETIEWMRPDMARIFASGPGCLEVEFPDDPDGSMGETATKLLYQRIFEDEDGLGLVDQYFFNGALQKLGVIGVYWEDERLGQPKEMKGLNLQQVQDLSSDEETYEVLGGEQDGMDAETGTETYTLVVQKVEQRAKPCMEVIPPEYFRCSKRAVSLDRPPYVGHDTPLSEADVIALFPDKEEEIKENAGQARDNLEDDERRMARFEMDEAGGDARIEGREGGTGGEILLSREYIYHDQDGDGYPELLECYRLGTLMLSAEEKDENCYAAWSPIRIPHKLVGISIADITIDIQRTQTVLMRSALNAAMLAVAPRTAVSNKVNLTDLLTVRPGGIIRLLDGAQGMPGEHVYPFITPDVAASALKMMEKVDTQAETRTGVTRHTQGLNPDVLHKTMGGVALLQNAASVRKELTARNLAQGLSEAFTKYLRLIIRHGEKKQALGKGKARKEIDISGWSPNAKVKVHVGQGTGNREAQLMQLMQLASMQQSFIDKYGPDNPIVTPGKQYNTIEQITRAMGFRSAEPFFADPEKLDDAGKAKLAEMMQPKPDPKTQAEMAKLQATQAAAEKKFELLMAQLQQKGVLEREKIAAEVQSDREQLSAEVMLAREETQADAVVALANGARKAGSADTRVGGDKV